MNKLLEVESPDVWDLVTVSPAQCECGTQVESSQLVREPAGGCPPKCSLKWNVGVS